MLKGYNSLPPVILQIIGLLVFLFFCGFWAFTGRQSPELLAASGALIGTGLAGQAASTLKDQARDEEAPDQDVIDKG